MKSPASRYKSDDVLAKNVPVPVITLPDVETVPFKFAVLAELVAIIIKSNSDVDDKVPPLYGNSWPEVPTPVVGTDNTPTEPCD